MQAAEGPVPVGVTKSPHLRPYPLGRRAAEEQRREPRHTLRSVGARGECAAPSARAVAVAHVGAVSPAPLRAAGPSPPSGPTPPTSVNAGRSSAGSASSRWLSSASSDAGRTSVKQSRSGKSDLIEARICGAHGGGSWAGRGIGVVGSQG
jgi:hypothetical protein